MQRRDVLSALVLTSALSAWPMVSGCPDGGGDGDGDGDGDVSGDGDGDGDGDIAGDVFSVESINLNDDAARALPNRGLGLAVRDDGRWAVAFVGEGDGTSYMCQTLTGMTEGGDYLEVRVASDDGAGGFDVTVVDTIPGSGDSAVDVGAVGNNLFVAYNGGETANGYCGPSDLAIARESGGTFTPQIIATDSGDASGTCRLAENGEDSYCDIGDTVGRYPAVAVDADGTVAVSYQDFHNGFADKDINGTDLELARGNGAFSLINISTEAGAGYHSDVAFGPGGRVIIGHEVISNNQFVDSEGQQYAVPRGIYAAVEQADGSFIDQPVDEGGQTDYRVAVGYHPSFGWAVAYHDVVDDDIFVARSQDDGATWTAEAVDRLGLTGRSPALTFLSDGRPVVAYRYCAGPGSSTCSVQADRVRVAVRGDNGWILQNLPRAEEDVEGTQVGIAAGPNDTIWVVSYNNTRDYITLHKLSLL